MRLIATLEDAIAREDSMFRAQLMKEDVTRLQKLQTLAVSAGSLERFENEGMFIGWTQDDMRTHVISDAVKALLSDVYAYVHGAKSEADEKALEASWSTFNNERMEKLIKCL